MNRKIIALAGLVAAGTASADNIAGVDRVLCSAAEVQVCFEADTCYAATPVELGVPDFVVIDIDEKTISTTRASDENRSTQFTSFSREAGYMYLQGLEGGRAFSFVIDEVTGRMTVAVSRDGLTVSVFGACTDADI